MGYNFSDLVSLDQINEYEKIVTLVPECRRFLPESDEFDIFITLRISQSLGSVLMLLWIDNRNDPFVNELCRTLLQSSYVIVGGGFFVLPKRPV